MEMFSKLFRRLNKINVFKSDLWVYIHDFVGGVVGLNWID